MGAAFGADGNIIEVDLSIRRVWYGRFPIDLRIQMPGSDGDTYLSATLEPLDLRELEQLRYDPPAYGRTVGGWLLGGEAKAIFDKLNALSDHSESPIRLRISFDDTASDLHRVHWEMVRSPEDNRLLFVGEKLLFSRYIRTTDFRRVQRRSKNQLRSLLVITSPTNVSGQQGAGGQVLAHVNVEAERELAKHALSGIRTGDLGGGVPATLENIMDALRRNTPDILYLVCHGGIVDRQPRLWLEAPDRTIAAVEAEEFVARVVELRQRPSLVVLASCQSAGPVSEDDATIGDDGVLAGLGPRLASEGIPAVLAMQGNVTIGTLRQFFRAFFSELSQHGQLDHAASVARGKVRDRRDAWAPVLFTRLKGGGIWYRQGWDSEDGSQLMPGLKRAIDDGRCTPIIGPGLLDNLRGNRREIAAGLAARHQFALPMQDRDDLPQVAQFQSVQHTRDTLVADYLSTICDGIRSRFLDVLSPNLKASLRANAPTPEIRNRYVALLEAAWQHRMSPAWGEETPEPHSQVTQLPFGVFITTNADRLLESAINNATMMDPVTGIPVKKLAQTDFFRWSPDLPLPPTGRGPTADPSSANPLVYHLFGDISIPDSIVLTQDDYFDSLIAASNPKRLPMAVRTAFTNKTLLFLGFNVDDWHFRVLFRFIVNLPGVNLLGKHKHVAVQIDPEEQRFSDPQAARRYLAKYFLEKRIHIYWGTVDDFVRELKRAYDDETVLAER
jgi:hypothetical protein